VSKLRRWHPTSFLGASSRCRLVSDRHEIIRSCDDEKPIPGAVSSTVGQGRTARMTSLLADAIGRQRVVATLAFTVDVGTTCQVRPPSVVR
jgi:hypothetical protein